MSNEEIIEEILTKSYELGVYDEVLELFNKLKNSYDRCLAFQIAFNIATYEPY